MRAIKNEFQQLYMWARQEWTLFLGSGVKISYLICFINTKCYLQEKMPTCFPTILQLLYSYFCGQPLAFRSFAFPQITCFRISFFFPNMFFHYLTWIIRLSPPMFFLLNVLIMVLFYHFPSNDLIKIKMNTTDFFLVDDH